MNRAIENRDRNFSRARLEWNQAKGIASVLVSGRHGEVAEDGGGVNIGVLAATEVGMSVVEKVAPASAGLESHIRDDGEAARVGSVAVLELEMV